MICRYCRISELPEDDYRRREKKYRGPEERDSALEESARALARCLEGRDRMTGAAASGADTLFCYKQRIQEV